MHKFTTAVVVRLAAAVLAGTALSATVAQVASAAAPNRAAVTTAPAPAPADGSGNVIVTTDDNWPWG